MDYITNLYNYSSNIRHDKKYCISRVVSANNEIENLSKYTKYWQKRGIVINIFSPYLETKIGEDYASVYSLAKTS